MILLVSRNWNNFYDINKKGSRYFCCLSQYLSYFVKTPVSKNSGTWKVGVEVRIGE